MDVKPNLETGGGREASATPPPKAPARACKRRVFPT